MNTLQIKYFLSLAQKLNFSEVAQEFYISQSAVSKQIAALEEELGFPLFYRSTHRVALTAYGERMEHFFRDSFREFDAVRRDILAMMEQQKNTLKIGIQESLKIENMTAILKAFSSRHSECRISFAFRVNAELHSLLNSGEIDIAIMLLAGNECQDGVSCRTLASSRRVFLISNQHPLAEKAVLAPEDLNGQTFIVPPQMEGTEVSDFTSILEYYSLKPKAIVSMPNMESALFSVEMDQSVILADERLGLRIPDRFRSIDTGFQCDVVCSWREGTNQKLAEEFSTMLTEGLSADKPD